MTTKQPKSPAEKMADSKTKLIKRLRGEIKWVREDAEEKVKAIEGRIRIAQSLLDALQKGTLRP